MVQSPQPNVEVQEPANKHAQTLEERYCSNTTPKHLIDPLTGSIFRNPIVQPVSGRTVSEYLTLERPQFDLWANKEYDFSQKAIPNKDTQLAVLEYMKEHSTKLIEEMCCEIDFKERLVDFSLMLDHPDLNFLEEIIPQFQDVFWTFTEENLAYVDNLTPEERGVLFRTLSWGGFPIEKCIAKLQFSPDTSYCVRLCKLFSGPSEAYEVLEVRKMLESDCMIREGLQVTIKFMKYANYALLECYTKEKLLENTSLESLWRILRYLAYHFGQSEFTQLITSLSSLPSEISDTLVTSTTPMQAIINAEMKYNSKNMEERIKTIEAKYNESQKAIEMLVTKIIDLSQLQQTPPPSRATRIELYRQAK